MDKHTKAVISAYKSLKKDHERILRLVSDLLDAGELSDPWAERLACEISRLGVDRDAESAVNVS